MNKDEFWKLCLGHIKTAITDQAYSTWFDGLELISLNDEELTIQVPNKFHFEWLESKYRHLIDDAIQKVGKRDGYDYIFNVVSGPIVYALPQYEVTDQVIEELQKVSDINNE